IPASEPLFPPRNDRGALSVPLALAEPGRTINGGTAPYLIVVSVAVLLAGFLFLLRSGPEYRSTLPFTQITSSDSVFPGDIGVEKFSTLVTDGARLYFSKIEK